jgi:hypothetical protein
MSHEPAVTPPVTPAGGPPFRTAEPHDDPPHDAPRRGRRWRGPRRRALAYVAGIGVAAGAGVAIQACADGGVAPTSPARAPQLETPAPGGNETSKSGRRAPFDLALVGELHNRGLDAVLARARDAGAEHRTSHKTRCALVARLSAEFARTQYANDPRLAAIGTGGLGDDVLAGIAKQAACGFDEAARLSLAEAAVAAAGGAAGGGEQRTAFSETGQLSVEAQLLLHRVDDSIKWMRGAHQLSVNLMPIQIEAEALPDPGEQVLVRETIETARASAYYQEQQCQINPTSCGSNDRPPDATRADGERRAGVNSDVVKADAWGCILGGIKGWPGGGPGIATGCLWGGLAGSGGIIFRHIF